MLAAGGAIALSMRLAYPEQVGWGVFGGLVLAVLAAGLGPALFMRWWGEVPAAPQKDWWILPNLAFALAFVVDLCLPEAPWSETLSVRDGVFVTCFALFALTPVVAAVRHAGGGVSFRLLTSGWGAFALIQWTATISPAWERDDGLGTGFFIMLLMMGVSLYTAEVVMLAILSGVITRRSRRR